MQQRLIVLLLSFIVMCAFTVNGATGFNDWNNLQRQVYIGGYLEYNTSYALSNQLAPGYDIPIRFGKLKKDTIAIDNISGDILTIQEKAELKQKESYVTEYTDIQQESQYGTITIKSINLNMIVFDYFIYNTTGSTVSSGTFTVALNQKADLNQDGYYDITFTDNIPDAKAYKPHIRYLEFVSSQNELHTTMYSYNKFENSTLNQDSKYLGLNLNGKRLFVVENAASPSGTLKSQSVDSYDMDSGDIMLDINSGEYKVVSGMLKSAVSSLGALSKSAAQTMDVDEALPLLSLNGKTTYNSDNDATTVFDSKTEYAKEVNHFKEMVKAYPINLPPIPISKMFGDNVKVGIKDGELNIGIDINASVSWKGGSFSTNKMIMINGHAGIEMAANAVFETKATPQTIISRSMLVINYDYSGEPVKVLALTFAIGPVLVDVGVNITAGIKGKIEVKANENIGVDFCRIIKTEQSVEISWFNGINKTERKYKRLLLCPSLSTSLEVCASIIPYVELELYCKLWKVLYVGIKGRFAMGPEFNAKVVKSTNTDNRASYVSCELKLKQELGINLEIGFKFKIKVLFIKKDIDKTWSFNLWKFNNQEVLLSYCFPLPPLNQIYAPTIFDVANSTNQNPGIQLNVNTLINLDQYKKPEILNIINAFLLND